MMTSNLLVYASQIAACIGKNRYKLPHEALETVWKRVDPMGFKRALVRCQRQDPEDRLKELALTHVDIDKVLKTAAESVPQTAAETIGTLSSVTSEVPVQKLSKEDAALVQDKVRENLFCGYGTRSEDSVFHTLTNDMGFDLRKDTTFHWKMFGQYKGAEWGLGGRIDAISADGTTVIEIKNRVRRLFEHAVEYENVQIQSYMHILDSATKGMLVEVLKTETSKMGLIPVEKDEVLWEETILPRLTVFCEYLIDLLHDEHAQNEYFSQQSRSDALLSRFEDCRR